MSWETWLFAFNVTAPNLVMLLLGIFLRKIALLDDSFCDKASRLVFNFALPCLLFFSIAKQHTEFSQHIPLALYGAIATLISFLLLEWVAPKIVKNPAERGIFVQGGFRANTAILGLAYAANAYGEEGVAIGSVYMVATVILFNVLSVITLTRSLQGGVGSIRNVREMLSGIVRNPLIISILLGLFFSWSKLPVPAVVAQSGNLLAGLALPLALLCTGVSLNFRAMLGSRRVTGASTFAKLVAVPLLVTIGAVMLGFRDVSLGIIFLFTATPTAAASYVMARSMGGNATLAANIIALTMLGSFFTISLGLYLLRGLQLA